MFTYASNIYYMFLERLNFLIFLKYNNKLY